MSATYRFVTIATVVLLAVGCNSDPPKPAGGKPSEHEHASAGPHGGDLIELGDETYHVELIHDDRAGEVTFYVLDGTAKKTVPIDAADVTVNLKLAGGPKQFQVAAKADSADPAGKSSRFFSADKELAEGLDAAGADAQIVLTIDGKQFRGAIAHKH
jgi:hypothetical protein